MKIQCPGCTAVKEIGDTSRFATFQCRGCRTKFKGFEARVPFLSYAFGLFNPFSGQSVRLFMKDKTWCPKCGQTIGLAQLSDGSFAAPSVCCYCTRELDNAPAQPQDPVDFVI